jgi:sugar/nucleoside kinase (ribokinase family)
MPKDGKRAIVRCRDDEHIHPFPLLNLKGCRALHAVRRLPALPVPPERVIDTNGAGDVFHGAYVYSYLANPAKSWQEHFEFARAASTFKVQRLGNEAGLPTVADIDAIKREFQVHA